MPINFACSAIFGSKFKQLVSVKQNLVLRTNLDFRYISALFSEIVINFQNLQAFTFAFASFLILEVH